jgi:hypothetical protein
MSYSQYAHRRASEHLALWEINGKCSPSGPAGLFGNIADSSPVSFFLNFDDVLTDKTKNVGFSFSIADTSNDSVTGLVLVVLIQQVATDLALTYPIVA